MNISAWAIKKPIPVIVLFMVLTIAGWLGFKSLSVQNLPDFDLPVVTVTAAMPGATASNMETEVAKKLEDSFASIDKLEHITTSVTEGVASITLQFLLEKDVQEAVDDIKDSISQVKKDLPTALEEPIVKKLTMAGRPLLTYTVQAEGVSRKDLSWFVDNDVSRAVTAVTGVSQITRQGGASREIRVELDQTKMAGFGVTAAEVSRQLRSRTLDSAGGRSDLGGQEQTVRAVGALSDIEALSSFPLRLGQGGGYAPLSGIATVTDTEEEQRQRAWVDGKEVVSFQVFRSKGTSEVTVGAAVRDAVGKLQAQRPDVKITEVNDNVKAVQTQYDSTMSALYEGAFLAVVVVFFFLRNGRATFVSAAALPLSIIPTFFAISAFGFSLNSITLLALTLVVGILVDDAIVEVENIVRHQNMGKKPMVAARDAAAEIGLAVIATSFTLVAVFLPVAFMAGIPGKFFKQFGITASIAVLMSLLVARLLTPVMAATMLKGMKDHDHVEDARWHKTYMRGLDYCLHRPWRVMAFAVAFFVMSVALLGQLPAGFVPKSESGKVEVAVEMAPGTTLDETSAVIEQARARIQALPEVTRVYSIAGGSTIRKGSLSVDLVDGADETAVESKIREQLSTIPAAKLTYGQGGSGETLQIVLSGEDPVKLNQAASDLARDLRTIPGLGNVSSSASLVQPELAVRVDLVKAAAQGVLPSDIGTTIKVATEGDVDQNLAKLNEGLRQIPVRVQLAQATRTDIGQLEQLRVPGANGQVILSNVADISLESGPAEISRYDRSRNVTITAELAGLQIGEVAKKVNELPSMKNLPEGVSRAPAGDMERMMELFKSFGLAMALGILAVYVVLVLLFHDFVQPLTILMALPLSIGGAVLALMAGGYALGMPSLIGLLMLMGIVTKNSILLVEYAVRTQREGFCTALMAMEEACAKRVRPILMTTVAMGAGMLPIALSTTGDSSFRAPMAAAVIGGLLTSTMLSLFVVPAFYQLVDRLETRLRIRRWGKKRKQVLKRQKPQLNDE